MTTATLISSHEANRHSGRMPWAHRPARLNIFQRLVRQWERLHPYNGAQIMKIRGQADLATCRAAWDEALESLNLGAVCLSNGWYHYRQLNGDARYHTVVQCPDETDLDHWISAELNRPFNTLGDVPFRPFIIQKTGFFWIGVVYQHWVADSASIRMLMREWFVRQYDPSAALSRPVRLGDGRYWSTFGSHREGWGATGVLLSFLRWQTQFRKARRTERRQSQDLTQRFALLETSNDMIDPLRGAARSAGATVNDIFLAAIAQACERYGPARRRLRRSNLAVGAIVDLRANSDRPLEDVFDLLLGIGSICCQEKYLKDWNALLKSVSRQTRQQKSGALPLASYIRFAAGLIAGKFVSGTDLIDFYRKRVPLAGASSNVNLNRCWPAKYDGDPLLDYIRVAPTGPVTPIVFTTTTLGSRLSIGLTYRPALVSQDRAALLGSAFLHRMREAAKGR